MAKIKKLETTCGEAIEYIDDAIDDGERKKVYLTPDKLQVVVIYNQTPPDPMVKDKLVSLVEKLSPLKDQEAGDYWKNLFLGWPTRVIDSSVLGYVADAIPAHFFFETGSMKGQAKEGKWVASAKLLKLLDTSEKGKWLNYFKILISLSRAVHKMNKSGIAHSDLLLHQVLADPRGGKAALRLDIDDMIIPDKPRPEVLATSDLTAPEVIKTIQLDSTDPDKELPRVETDRHSLAVLIYMFLLHRHPLRGGLVHDLDPATDEAMTLGKKALFIEHPSNKSNRPQEKTPPYMPWIDVDQIPYTVTGPYLKKLFDEAFIDGLHDPRKRPTAKKWITELIKTVDLMQPCGNEKCEQGWFVIDKMTKPSCPFCGWKFQGSMPVLIYYSVKQVMSEKDGSIQEQHIKDGSTLMVYNDQHLYRWHVYKHFLPTERLTPEAKKPVGYFAFHKGKWVLVNQKIPDLEDFTEKKKIAIDKGVELKDGKIIRFSKEDGGRFVKVKMVNA